MWTGGREEWILFIFCLPPTLSYSTWTDCIDAWLDEEKQYDFSQPGFFEATGHFTQCVWKGSTHIGCATKSCPDGVLYSCNYAPPGNVIGQFQQNVLPPA